MRDLFKDILLPDQITTNPHDLTFYGKDWLREYTPNPRAILFPKSTEEVSQIVLTCKEKKIALVPSGGRTGLSGGATATSGEAILSLEKMNKILGVDPIAQVLRTQAGASTEKIQKSADEHSLFFPLEFTTKGSSQIGGNIATNAGGIRVIKYGNIRDWVLGLTVVTGTGEILSLNGELRKNNTGYDLRNLIIGSEGTLAIITEATLRLTRKPTQRTRFLCAVSSLEKVLDLFYFLRGSSLDISAFEYFPELGLSKVLAHNQLNRPFTKPHPHYALVEVEGVVGGELELCFEKGLIDDAVLGESQRQSDELLELRERIGETLSTHYHAHKNDLSFPITKIPEAVVEIEHAVKKHTPECEVVIFGHIGDGNLHVNLLKPPSWSKEEFIKRYTTLDHAVFGIVKKYSGSISAEHGVGLLKKAFLTYSRSEAEISLMRAIKKAFDPASILNPGKIF